VAQYKVPPTYSLNPEHHQDDAVQDFDSDENVIMDIPVTNDNKDEALAMEQENCTLWINQPVDWTSFPTNAYSKAKNEDLKKELQTIHGWFLHIDPLKWFRESSHGKQKKFAPFCILASFHLARADSGAFQESMSSTAGVNMSTRQTYMLPERYAEKVAMHHNNKFVEKDVYKISDQNSN
jgi:hypothetical protein